MSSCSTSMFDADGVLVGYVKIGPDGLGTFFDTSNTNLGDTPPSGWTTQKCPTNCTPVDPPVDPTPGAWWLSTYLGGTGDETLGTAVFPGGPRVSLTTQAGDLTITTPGTVVSAKNITGRINVNAANVTIRDTQMYGVNVLNTIPDGSGPVIEYCKISPPNCWTYAQGATEGGIQYANYSVSWTEITNTFDGLKAFGNVTVDNCYIHHMSPCSNAGNTGGGYAHGDGIQTGGGTGLTVSNSFFGRTGENAGIFLFRDAAGGTGTNPIDTVSITNCTITQSGNFGLWIEEASDPAITGSQRVPSNVTVNNLYLGCAHDTNYLYPTGTSPAPTWRGKLQMYFPTTTFNSSGWGNVYSLNGTASPALIPYVETHTGSNYCTVNITV